MNPDTQMSKLLQFLFVKEALLVAVVLGATIIHIWLACVLPLVDDETYYRLWGLAPAMGYFDHPPMVGWWIAGGQLLWGDTTLGIRFGSIVSALILPLAIWRIATLYFDYQIAFWSVIFLFAMPMLAVGALLMTPDAPSVFFGVLTLWALAEMQHSKNAYWWLVVGVLAGFGILSKFTNLFVGVSILLLLLLDPKNRCWFKTWQLWIGGFLALLICAPMVQWNYEHDWVTFTKQFGRIVSERPFSLKYEAELIGAAVLLVSPLVFVLVCIGFLIALKRVFSEKHSGSVFLCVTIAPAMIYFFIHGLHSRVQANWLAPLYPLFAIAGAVAVVQKQVFWGSSRLALSSIGLGVVMIVGLYFHALSPLVLYKSRKDPVLQMYGWSELAENIRQKQSELGTFWVATSKYTTTGQLSEALKGTTTPVYEIGQRIRYANLPRPELSLLQKPALYVELKRRVSERMLQKKFANVRKLVPLVRSVDGYTVSIYALYFLSEPKRDWLRSMQRSSP